MVKCIECGTPFARWKVVLLGARLECENCGAVHEPKEYLRMLFMIPLLAQAIGWGIPLMLQKGFHAQSAGFIIGLIVGFALISVINCFMRYKLVESDVIRIKK